ncbi:MAG: BMP family ABC transporter substrate-binding protein [Acidimicrobiaceae bacterium]|nr:BMP family ABC transporter substrate-binding protein [Acidimicrobiaceae bacterium]
MLKRIRLLTTILVFVLLTATWTACNGDTTEDTDGSNGNDNDSNVDNSEAAISVGVVYDVTGKGDQSFNDAAAAGIERAENELNIEYTELTPNKDGSDRAELLQLAADSHDLVVAVGFLYEPFVVDAATENQDVQFGVVDTPMLDFESDPSGQPYGDNISGLVFTEHEGSFLVGAAAALKSQTGTIGFIGGVANAGGLIEKFQAGYEAGALAVDPEITIFANYITEAPDSTGWQAPDRAQEIALSMYENGADIIYHAAGGSGLGLFAAAKKHSETVGSKVWAIGVDSDQYHTVDPEVQDYVLTSMLKRVDVAIFELVKSTIEDNTEPGAITYDLAVEGVDYSTSGGFIDDIVEQLESLKAQIVAGDIDVPTVPNS